MKTAWNHISKALALSLVLFLFSCASYNQQASDFYNHLEKGEFAKASKKLDHNRLLKKRRNRLLYLLEKGRLEHLLGNYKASNVFFEEADLLMETSRANFGDYAIGTLLNPMMETYRGEDFEKYMVHYYKAINYLQLGVVEDALVEARRISIRTFAQEDVKKSGRYTGDAFSFMMQGLIYEAAKDYNNAFIAYRNSVDLYLQKDGKFYGTALPQQLKIDLLRMAKKNGFEDEVSRYEQLLQLTTPPDEEEGSLVVFWEQGLAPVKIEQQLFFNLYESGGSYYFRDSYDQYKVPFDQSFGYDRSRIDLTKLHSIRVAIPRYEMKKALGQPSSIQCNGKNFSLEAAQNINELAFATLQERWLKDLSRTLTRLAIKKLAEEAAKPKDDEKNEKKKTKQEALSMGLKIFSLASEKADTRNWQSLPHSIFYTRVPLQKGSNVLTLPSGEKTVQSTGGIYFQNISSVR